MQFVAWYTPTTPKDAYMPTTTVGTYAPATPLFVIILINGEIARR